METSIGELTKMVVGFMGIIMLCILGLFLIKIQDINTFQQTVNYTIEREGGLTPTAVSDIKKESKENFGGSFSLTSNDLNKEKKFGEVVTYSINQKFNFHFFRDFNFSMTRNGKAVSQVRTFN